jgi:hypothetical protein
MRFVLYLFSFVMEESRRKESGLSGAEQQCCGRRHGNEHGNGEKPGRQNPAA